MLHVGRTRWCTVVEVVNYTFIPYKHGDSGYEVNAKLL